MTNVASHGTLRDRRALVESIREVVPVALDMFQLGHESEIGIVVGYRLPYLLQLALVDYRNRYTDTRREQLLRRDQEDAKAHQPVPRSLVCLFCAEVLATRATTRESYRIAQLMIEEPTDEDRDISIRERGGSFDVKLVADPDRALWCVADVREAIRPHVVVCALTSLGELQVPQRPGVRFTRRDGGLPL